MVVFNLPFSSKHKLMLIDNSKKIKDLQMEFHRVFPGLKLEFYKGSHHDGEASPARLQLDSELPLSAVQTVHTSGNLRISEEMTVTELEQLFHEKFGLNAQVFRRSGNLWLQTSATDHWTLAEQNRKGSHSEQLFREKREELDFGE
jgi:hypothetical protein